MYHLLDHCNARNAAELAQCAAIGPECAKALGTLEWAPTSEYLQTMACHRYYPTPLGYGDKIRCGAVMDADEYDVREFGTAALSRNNYNVCRHFDEAQAATDEIKVWLPIPRVLPTNMPPDANAPETVRFELSERYCCRPSIGFSESDRELYGQSFGKADEQFFKSGALTESAVRLSSEAIRLSAEIDAWHQISAVRFRCVLPKSVECHTPPNHGHGAKCVCIAARLKFTNGEMDRSYLEALMHSDSATSKAVLSRLCPWCASTGRIICDDERAGRVSPSHAAGGYAEWQRRTMEFSVTDHDGTRPLGRITNMRSVDGFVVGDIELEDGSIVVERLMRSPFSSSEIGDAEPATTERE